MSVAETGIGLAELAARAEIIDLLYRYADGVHHNDPARIASCFAADAVVHFRGSDPVSGGEAILRFFESSLEVNPSLGLDVRVVSTPLLSNPMIEMDGDSARCESTCVAVHAGEKDATPTIVVRGVKYFDEAARQADGHWLLTRRQHVPMWGYAVDGKALGVPE